MGDRINTKPIGLTGITGPAYSSAQLLLSYSSDMITDLRRIDTAQAHPVGVHGELLQDRRKWRNYNRCGA
jgi:hypothetical protein